LSEQVQLLILQRRLKEIRKSRRNWTIIVFVVAIFLGFIWNGYGFDFFTGLVLWMFFGTLAVWVVNNYYRKQELGILWQIEQVASQSKHTV
jgi:hypothetical protein